MTPPNTSDAVRAVFAVPPHMMGPAPELRTRYQRGSYELAQVEVFEQAYPGTDLPLSDEAVEVWRDRTLRLMGLLP